MPGLNFISTLKLLISETRNQTETKPTKTLRTNNQQDASSNQNFILSWNSKCSGIYCAHHQELSVAHVAIVMFHAGYVAAAI
jgi:hypothetical protein